MTDDSRAARRDRYRTIQRVAKYNRGYAPVTPEPTVRQICCTSIGMSVAAYERHLRAVKEQGVMVVGSGYLWHPDTDPSLTEAIEYIVENADEPQAFVAAANRWRDG